MSHSHKSFIWWIICGLFTLAVIVGNELAFDLLAIPFGFGLVWYMLSYPARRKS
jgi:hypothetical protein